MGEQGEKRRGEEGRGEGEGERGWPEKQRSIEVAVLKLCHWMGQESGASQVWSEKAQKWHTHRHTHTQSQAWMHWLTVRRKWKYPPRPSPERKKETWALCLSPTCYTILECGERGRSFWMSVKWKEIVGHMEGGLGCRGRVGAGPDKPTDKHHHRHDDGSWGLRS